MSHPYESWTRRDFLRTAGRAGLLGAFPTVATAAAALEPDTVCISILHTTDLHGHILPTSDYDGTADRGGLARCVTQIADGGGKIRTRSWSMSATSIKAQR
jgi:uncharacterized protein (DUF1501 family)